MFRSLRKSDLAMDEKEAYQLLEEGEYAVVSMLSPDGYPYGFPVNYVLMDGRIYFHGAKEGHRMDCLKHSERVSAAVVGETELLPQKLDTNYESVILFGRASEVSDDEKRRALAALAAKYSPGFEEKAREIIARGLKEAAVVSIRIEHVSGKKRTVFAS